MSSGGVCLYDEGGRHDGMGYGVLGWLLAGTEALALSNFDDETLTRHVLDTLPKPLAHGRDLLIESRVHRWVGTVSSIPGGIPVQELRQRHQPEPKEHPSLPVIGDYLFDSTVNAVYDSANFATALLITELRRAQYAVLNDELIPSPKNDGALGPAYHDEYADDQPYEEAYLEYFCEYYTTDLIRVIWGCKPPYKLLDVGSATGITLRLFDKLGVEAWGVENSVYVHVRTRRCVYCRINSRSRRMHHFPRGLFETRLRTCSCSWRFTHRGRSPDGIWSNRNTLLGI